MAMSQHSAVQPKKAFFFLANKLKRENIYIYIYIVSWLET